eukprot:5614659-Amphidinium_carterae.1
MTLGEYHREVAAETPPGPSPSGRAKRKLCLSKSLCDNFAPAANWRKTPSTNLRMLEFASVFLSMWTRSKNGKVIAVGHDSSVLHARFR